MRRCAGLEIMFSIQTLSDQYVKYLNMSVDFIHTFKQDVCGQNQCDV